MMMLIILEAVLLLLDSVRVTYSLALCKMDLDPVAQKGCPAAGAAKLQKALLSHVCFQGIWP